MQLRYVWLHRMPLLARGGLARMSNGLLSVALVCTVGAATWSCSTEPEWSSDPCSSHYVPWASNVIGPSGGVVTYDIPGDVLDSLRVAVPAGKWAQCWEVTVSYVSLFSTPDYPDGFVPFERPWPTGSVAIAIFRQNENGEKTYAPDSMYLEVSFPLHGLPSDSVNFVSAFYYDSTATDWRVRLPDDVNASFLTVHTGDWKQPWSFGRIDFADIDFETYMVPALEERVGTQTWSRIRATVDSLYEAAMQHTWDPVTCTVLNIAEAVFTDFRNRSAAMVASIQAGFNCGSCDATTVAFYEDLKTYVKLKLQYMILEMFVDAVPGRAWPLKLAGFFVMGGLQAAMDNLPCDYECVRDNAPPGYYLYTATYGASALIVSAIQWYRTSGYISCPGVSSNGLTLGSAVGFSATAGAAPLGPCAGSRPMAWLAGYGGD